MRAVRVSGERSAARNGSFSCPRVADLSGMFGSDCQTGLARRGRQFDRRSLGEATAWGAGRNSSEVRPRGQREQRPGCSGRRRPGELADGRARTTHFGRSRRRSAAPHPCRGSPGNAPRQLLCVSVTTDRGEDGFATWDNNRRQTRRRPRRGGTTGPPCGIAPPLADANGSRDASGALQQVEHLAGALSGRLLRGL